MWKKKQFTIAFLIVFFIVMTSNVSATDRMTTTNDYTFTSTYRIATNDGWTYNLANRGVFERECVVLSVNYYYIDSNQPINTISFIDIAIGSGYVVEHYDEIKENIFIDWGIRFGRFYYTVYDHTTPLFLGNITNLHCIARDNESAQMLLNVVPGNVYNFTAELVDVNGYEKKSGRSITWPTGDGTLGDTKCEIILLSNTGVISIAGNAMISSDMITIIACIIIIAVVSIVVLIFINQWLKEEREFYKR